MQFSRYIYAIGTDYRIFDNRIGYFEQSSHAWELECYARHRWEQLFVRVR